MKRIISALSVKFFKIFSGAFGAQPQLSSAVRLRTTKTSRLLIFGGAQAHRSSGLRPEPHFKPLKNFTNNVLNACLFLGLAMGWVGCEKPPAYDDTPHIEWAEFSQDTIQQLSDAVAFRFNFTDGDGDLGKDNDPQDHILIIDTRRTPNDTAFYKIPTIPQQGTISGISGQIEVTMSQICCIHPTNPLILCQPINNYFDPIVYKIKIRDNAGRWSNEILTDTLYVKCF